MSPTEIGKDSVVTHVGVNTRIYTVPLCIVVNVILVLVRYLDACDMPTKSDAFT